MIADAAGYERVGSIAPFLQIGGDSAPRQGWRIAASMIWSRSADDFTLALEGQGEDLYATGAFTDAMAAQLLRRRGIPHTVSVEDGTRLLLSRESYEKLRARGVAFRVRRQNELIALTVNPFSAYGAPYDPAAFQALVESKVNVPVIDVFKESQWN